MSIATITSESNDGYVYSTSSTYPPQGGVVRNEVDSYVIASRQLSGGKYTVHNGLLRFNTTVIPDSVSVTAATLRLNVSLISNVNGMSIRGEWVDWTGDGTSDYQTDHTVGTTAFEPILISSFIDEQYKDITLLNLDAIHKDQKTGIRLHLVGGQPSGVNYLYFKAYDWGVGFRPELVVTYSPDTPQDAPSSPTPTSKSSLITTTSNDQYIYATAPSYPPEVPVVRSSIDSYIIASRQLTSGKYTIHNGLIEFDTSIIPDGVTINYATLRLHASIISDANARSIRGEWHNWRGDRTSDYQSDPVAGTTAFDPVLIGGITDEQYNEFNLLNLDQIRRDRKTGVRLHITGGAPSGINYLYFKAYDWGVGYRPELIINYSPNTALDSSSSSDNTVTVNVTDNSNDQYIYANALSYPPKDVVARSDNDSYIIVSRQLSSGRYIIHNGLLEFDTSALPDDITINYATLQLHAAIISDANGLGIRGEWYPWSGVAVSDFNDNPSVGLNAFNAAPIGGVIDEQYNEFNLLNLDEINPKGKSRIRLHITGAAPSGINYLYFKAHDWGVGYRPTLVINYTPGGGGDSTTLEENVVINTTRPPTANDDQYISRTSTTYPPTATPVRNATDSYIITSRQLSAGNYIVHNGLLRFDTSIIPDGNEILYATLRLHASIISDANGRNLRGEYYNWSGTATSDQENDPLAGITAFDTVPVGGVIDEQFNEINLLNLSNINKQGITGLRLHITGGVPSGVNYLYFKAYDWGVGYRPELIVAHRPTAGQSSIILPVASGSDDRTTWRDTNYPPTNGPFWGGADQQIDASRRLDASVYWVSNALMRFPTQLIPDDAIILDAQLNVYVYQVLNANALSLTADWVNWVGDSSTAQSNTPGTNAITGIPLSTISTGLNTFSLQNAASFIRKNDTTGLRFHISQRASNAAPTGNNRIDFYSFESTAFPQAELVVYYQIAGKTDLIGIVGS